MSLFDKRTFKLTELNPDGSPAIAGAVFEADAVINENYSKKAMISTYPVESGVNVSDHSMISQLSYTMTGVTSDASMSYFNLIDDLKSSALGGLLGFEARSQEAFNQLEQWMNEGTPLMLTTKFKKDGFKDSSGAITPFLIESMTTPRQAKTGSSIRYTLSMKQIQLVTVGEETLTDIGMGFKDKGSQGLIDNQKSKAMASQKSNVRTIAPLRDNVAAQGRTVAKTAASIL